MTYKETEKAWAKYKGIPTAPPISAPKDLLIKKYAPPPFTGALVAMADIDKEVRKVMVVERVTISKVPINPTLPTTQPNLRYMITPQIVSKDGVKTPPKVPSLAEPAFFILFIFI
jgi:hypothetical protein